MTPEQLTISALVIAAAIALYQAGRKRIWVWGYQLEDERTEKEFWRGLYLRVAGLTEELITEHEPQKRAAPADGRRQRSAASRPRRAG